MSSLHASTVKHWHAMSTLIQVIVLISLPVTVATIFSALYHEKYAGLFRQKGSVTITFPR